VNQSEQLGVITTSTAHTSSEQPTLSQHHTMFPIALCIAIIIASISAFPYEISHDIKARHSQCIMSRLGQGDFATFEIFVTDAKGDGRRSGAVQIEGPVANNKIGDIDENGNRQWRNAALMDAAGKNIAKRKTNTMGAALQESINNWPNFVQGNHRHFQEAGVIHQAFHIDWTYSGESEDAIAARDAIAGQRKAYLEEQRQRNLERAPETDVYEESSRIEQIIPEHVEPYEWTKAIKAPGWYRLCIQAENFISVEMDIRSGADFGGVNSDTGHVYTWDEKEDLEEDAKYHALKSKQAEDRKLQEEVKEMLDGQVKENDLDTTGRLMGEVNQKVSQIQKRQGEARSRMKAHSGDARRSRNRIARSGMVETVLYFAITLFQLWTIRKWLLSSNMLGR